MILNVALNKNNTELKKQVAAFNEDINKDGSIHFIWNDDEESIPTVNSPVYIEDIDNNIIYLTPNKHE